MILVNGHKIDRILINDRGFQYGDGLFETIEVLEGQPVFLSHHLQRLLEGCTKLKIPFPDKQQLKDEIIEVCRHNKSAVLKINISRGIGDRGYRQPENIEPTRVISLFPYPSYPESYYNEGITAIFCKTPLGLNPVLAGIKHTNRLEQVMARAEWDTPDIQEGIMLDLNNYVIEGTMTNLFYIKNNIVYTSELQFSGVVGVIRTILKQLLNNNNLKLIEQYYYKETLLDADEIFICNSIIGIWPVKQIENVSFKAGNMTKQLQNWLQEAKTSSYNL
jgi:4-amino-4-deoxychorismate lyase